MALFQPSVLNKYLKLQDKEVTAKAYKKFTKHFHNVTIQDNIKNSKEEEYQGPFLTDLFVNILGYTMKPQPNFNLVAEQKNQTNSKKSDGAILKDETAIAVIELKGTKTKDLKSITEQAFGYKANQKGCTYVITSNYEKLRFYINDATEYLEFNLFTLTETDFELLYLCTSKDSIFSDLPHKIKTESIVKEEQITKEFYKDYSLFKRELYRDLVKLNAKSLKTSKQTELAEASLEDEQLQKELVRLEKNVKLALFKKSQKLIDRFLFVFFAEDRGLLPPNSTVKILEDWNKLKELDAVVPLYNRFKLYFNYLDTGRAGTDKKAEIYAYNGGLFKPDSILDKIEISDELLYEHTLKLSNYNFDSQIDVNILGHIFENSLNEIESVNAEIEGGDFDKQKSKRKKDGVFYTPKYITKYIVENTVGKLCEEKKTELGFSEEDYYKSRKGRKKETLTKLIEVLDTYREWLLQLTICDPACGSGAFLNQALDFLIKEHTYIDELKTNLLGGSLVLSDIENTILENNIFGVDLNEESVEIAKLSLWLRTAQPRRKLNNLSSNIKCGNSLIESKAIAGDKAFIWEEQFPKVFEKGGFDVIIGNPPYVRAELFGKKHKDYFESNYFSPFKQYDIYVLFYEKGNEILRKDGLLGYITPNKFYLADYGKKIRQFILENTKIEKIIDVSMMNIFPDASVYPTILIFANSKIKNEKIVIQPNVNEPNQLDFDLGTNISQQIYYEADDYIINSNISNFKTLAKMDIIGEPLGDIFKITRGFRPPKIELVKNAKENGAYPYLIGEALRKPYNVNWNGNYVKYIPSEIPESKPIDILTKPKVMVRDIGLKFNAYFDEGHFFCLKTIYFIYGSDVKTLKYLSCLLNSNLMNFYFKERFSSMHISGGYMRFRKQFIEKVPIIIDKEKLIRFNEFCDFQTSSNKKNQSIINGFLNYLKHKFHLEKLTKKLQNWHELEFGDFIKELNKAIKSLNKERAKNGEPVVPALTKSDEMEWMELFNTKKEEAQALKTQIDQTDREIDQMVYKLYELTHEEIEIVEKS